MGDASSRTTTLDRPPAAWCERDATGVERWRRVGRPQAEHPEGRRFHPLACSKCGSSRVLLLAAIYEGWMNGNSEGSVDYACLACEAFTTYAYRD